MMQHLGLRRYDDNSTSELVFEVTKEADGGYCAECLTAEIFTQGDTWEAIREVGRRFAHTTSTAPRPSEFA